MQAQNMTPAEYTDLLHGLASRVQNCDLSVTTASSLYHKQHRNKPIFGRYTICE
jgi:hypothetical protein